MMVVFEITPTQFNTDAVERDFSPGNIANIKLQYRLPNDTTKRQFLSSVPMSFTDFNSIDRSFRFSTSVIMFGSLLHMSTSAKNMSWNDVILMASDASDDNDPLQKEYVSLLKQAKILYSKHKKRKKLFFW
jgi:Ca-activated chloride channel family protein